MTDSNSFIPVHCITRVWDDLVFCTFLCIVTVVCVQKYSPPPPIDCISPSLARPIDSRVWHSSSYWKRSKGEYVATYNGDGLTSIPPDGQDIRIEGGLDILISSWGKSIDPVFLLCLGMWMVVEKELPEMNKLWIEGVLEIDSTNPDLNITLSATHIVILVKFSAKYRHSGGLFWRVV